MGVITSLKYDAKGQPRISCETSHPDGARAGAFSIGGKIFNYEIKNADTKDFFAEVTAAEITERLLEEQW